MGHEFLSESWFEAVEALGDPPAGSGPDIGAINLVVTKEGSDDVQLHLSSGAMGRGLVDGAPTTLTVPYTIAKKLFLEQDQQAGMQAFMSGQIKIQGDMTKLMAMQGVKPTAEQDAYSAQVKELTDLS